jgi:hypothetical protein
MSELSCNIAMYHPNLKVLASRYRNWHVEAILEDAAALIERCLADYKEYSSLDYAWNRFQLELRIQEKQLVLDLQNEPEQPAAEEAPAAQEEAEPTAQSESESAEEAPGEGAETAPEEKEPQLEAAAALDIPKNKLELRTEAVRRKRELSSPGQPFALNDQRDITLKRLCRDYEEGVNRAWVAEQGLRKYYDHGELPSPLPTEAETLSESITNLAIWIRNAREWLVRYHQHEESFTRVISVRSFLGRNAWALLKHARDSHSIKLPLPPELFRGHDNCHLRGIGAYLVGEAGTVPWSMLVRLPEEALYDRWGQTVEVDQTGRSSCLLGRVENRKSPHPVEICGATSLLNASPIGRNTPGGVWLLELYKPAGGSAESFSHIEDIVLELQAVGIPQRSMS